MQKILFLHGALGSTENFSQLETQLQNDFEIYTFNFEGHGRRCVSETPLTIACFTKETLDFLNQNGIKKISVFGYSMGGYVGLYLARHFPQRVEKLFTLATKVDWTTKGATKETTMLNPEIIKQKVPKYAASLFTLHGENWEKLMRKTAEMMLDLGKSPVLQNEDFTQMTIPALIAVGDIDAMVTIEECVNVYRLMPDAQLLVLPGTPHPIDKMNIIELAHQIRKYFC